MPLPFAAGLFWWSGNVYPQKKANEQEKKNWYKNYVTFYAFFLNSASTLAHSASLRSGFFLSDDVICLRSEP
jgi:hypothetical protein